MGWTRNRQRSLFARIVSEVSVGMTLSMAAGIWAVVCAHGVGKKSGPELVGYIGEEFSHPESRPAPEEFRVRSVPGLRAGLGVRLPVRGCLSSELAWYYGHKDLHADWPIGLVTGDGFDPRGGRYDLKWHVDCLIFAVRLDYGLPVLDRHLKLVVGPEIALPLNAREVSTLVAYGRSRVRESDLDDRIRNVDVAIATGAQYSLRLFGLPIAMQLYRSWGLPDLDSIEERVFRSRGLVIELGLGIPVGENGK